jgi:hypothetical protein
MLYVWETVLVDDACELGILHRVSADSAAQVSEFRAVPIFTLSLFISTLNMETACVSETSATLNIHTVKKKLKAQ